MLIRIRASPRVIWFDNSQKAHTKFDPKSNPNERGMLISAMNDSFTEFTCAMPIPQNTDKQVLV
jgi:hypothetical protein